MKLNAFLGMFMLFSTLSQISVLVRHPEESLPLLICKLGLVSLSAFVTWCALSQVIPRVRFFSFRKSFKKRSYSVSNCWVMEFTVHWWTGRNITIFRNFYEFKMEAIEDKQRLLGIIEDHPTMFYKGHLLGPDEKVSSMEPGQFVIKAEITLAAFKPWMIDKPLDHHRVLLNLK